MELLIVNLFFTKIIKLLILKRLIEKILLTILQLLHKIIYFF